MSEVADVRASVNGKNCKFNLKGIEYLQLDHN